MAKFATQDRLYSDPSSIAREIIDKIILGHEKRELSKAQYRERKLEEKDAEVRKGRGPSNFSEVYKCVAEETAQ
jgi:hypothetical protein